MSIDPDELVKEPPKLKRLGGSQSDDWNSVIGNQVGNAIQLSHIDEQQDRRQVCAAVAGLIGIKPTDEIEGMIAAQLIAGHDAAMECYRRAALPTMPLPERSENL